MRTYMQVYIYISISATITCIITYHNTLKYKSYAISRKLRIIRSKGNATLVPYLRGNCKSFVRASTLTRSMLTTPGSHMLSVVLRICQVLLRSRVERKRSVESQIEFSSPSICTVKPTISFLRRFFYLKSAVSREFITDRS